jgi:hypothetical protein
VHQVGYLTAITNKVVVVTLWIKSTDALNSIFIGITTLHVSGTLSTDHQAFLAVHRLWYILYSCDEPLLPGVGWNCKQFHPTPGSNGSSQLHKMYQSRCMAKNSWWWAERLPETCRVVIPIKLEFSASVGFIHKESVTMRGHTILKLIAINEYLICSKCLPSTLKPYLRHSLMLASYASQNAWYYPRYWRRLFDSRVSRDLCSILYK